MHTYYTYIILSGFGTLTRTPRAPHFPRFSFTVFFYYTVLFIFFPSFATLADFIPTFFHLVYSGVCQLEKFHNGGGASFEGNFRFRTGARAPTTLNFGSGSTELKSDTIYFYKKKIRCMYILYIHVYIHIYKYICVRLENLINYSLKNHFI